MSHVSARCRLSDKEERDALKLCDELDEKLAIVEEHMQEMQDTTQGEIRRLIIDELSEKYEIESRALLAEYLKEVRIKFATKSLRCSDKELMYHFMMVLNKKHKLPPYLKELRRRP